MASNPKSPANGLGFGLSYEQLAAIVNQLPAGVMVAEAPSGRMLYANRAAEHIFGGPVTPTSDVESYDRNFLAWHRDGRPLSSEEFPLVRALSGQTVDSEYVVFQRRDGSLRTVRANAAPVRDDHGIIVAAVTTYHDVTDALRAEDNLRFFASVSEILANSLAYEETLNRVASLAVPQYADWCLVDLFRSDGTLEHVTVGHYESATPESIRALTGIYGARSKVFQGSPPLSQGRSHLVANLDDSLLTKMAQDPAHLAAMRRLGVRSFVSAPLVARGHTLGSLTLLSTHQNYSAIDLEFSEELARRAALAIDNARLLNDIQTKNEELSRWEKVFAHAGWGVAIVDPERDVVRAANLAFAEMHGYRNIDEVVGKPLEALFASSERDRIREQLNTAHALGHHIYESLHQRKDGTTFPVLSDVVAVKDATGHVLYRAANVQDITERKRVEEALQASEVRLRTLAETTTDIVWTADSHGIIDSSSPSWRRFTGTSAPASEAIHPSDRERVQSAWREALSTEGRFECEYLLRRHDGEIVPMATTAVPVRDGTAIREWVGTSVDITARRAEERERAELLEREQRARALAEAANRAKDEFLALLGHELRNPLAPIVTALRVMRLNNGGETSSEQLLIERQVEHLVSLVDDLLDVARITRGKVELKKEKIAVVDVVQRAVELASPILEQKTHHLELIIPPDLWLEADPVRLAQVLANLITNAAKYTPSGGRISVVAEREGDEVVVRTIDNGIGIAKDMLSSVFELLVQGPRTIDRAQGGLGIGLTLVQNLVQLHGGTVEARSEGIGRGTEMILRLPAPAAGVMFQPRPAAPIQELDPIKGRRVLIVDDNIDAGETLRDFLTADGHDVVLAQDGPEALALIETETPEVAILDIGLPVMDGFELATRLRERLPELRLIALTGYGQGTDKAKSAEAGFEAHLVKPANPDTLSALISGTLKPHGS